MNVTHVIPVVQPPDRIPAVELWTDSDIIVVDNTTLGLWADICARYKWEHVSMHKNLGVATSWNLGAQWAFKDGADLVSFVSSSVYWREHGLYAWTELARMNCDEYGCLTDQAFHASAWTRRTFDEIGWFDENFWPAYEEDTDWLRRLELAGIHVPAERADAVRMPERRLPKVGLDGQVDCEDAVSLKSGAVNVDFERNRRYYIGKWGGPKHAETFDKPFNLWVPLSWWPVLREV